MDIQPDVLRLDATDLEIMRCLQKNARMTYEAIGEHVHLSITPTRDRVRALRDAGFIKSFQAVFDWSKLGLPMSVSTLVKLREHKMKLFLEFETAIQKLPNLQQWQRVQGSWDYLLMFAVRDQAHYGEIYIELVGLEAVALTRTHTPQASSDVRPLPLPEKTALDAINVANATRAKHQWTKDLSTNQGDPKLLAPPT